MANETPKDNTPVNEPGKGGISSFVNNKLAWVDQISNKPKVPEKTTPLSPTEKSTIVTPEVQSRKEFFKGIPYSLRKQADRGQITYSKARELATQPTTTESTTEQAQQAEKTLQSQEEQSSLEQKSIHELLGLPGNAALSEIKARLEEKLKPYEDARAVLDATRGALDQNVLNLLEEGLKSTGRSWETAREKYIELIQQKREQIQQSQQNVNPDNDRANLDRIKGLDAYGLIQQLSSDFTQDLAVIDFDKAVRDTTEALELKDGWSKDGHDANLQAVERAVLLDIRERAL